MLSWLNSILCIAGMVICACRLGTKMTKQTTKSIIRLQYVMWLGLETFLLFVRPVDYTHVIMSSAVLAHLLITFPAWRHGLPQHAIKQQRGYGD